MIDVYNSHLVASYVDYKSMEKDNVHDEYLSHRVAQAFELAQFVRSTAHNPLVILAGDLNCETNSVGNKCIKSITGFSDAHSDTLVTFGAPDVTGGEKFVPNKYDYIYHKHSNDWFLAESNIFKKRIVIEGKEFSLSDHHGLTAVYEFAPQMPFDDIDSFQLPGPSASSGGVTGNKVVLLL
jgi:hypothetical protein